MRETADEVNTIDAYRRAWTSYRRRWAALGFATLALVPTILAIMQLLAVEVQFIAILMTLGGWLALWLGASTFRCPRCRNRFFWRPLLRNPLARRCLNCGLPKWATTDDGTQAHRPADSRLQPIDIAKFASGAGWSVALSCALAVPLIWLLKTSIAADPLIPHHISGGITRLARVITRQSPFIGMSTLILAISAGRASRGVEGAERLARAALLLICLLTCLETSSELLGATHDWFEFCLAFEEIFRGAPPPVAAALSFVPLSPIYLVPAQLLFCAWLYRGLKRADGPLRRAKSLSEGSNRESDWHS